jgi:ADP-heptose:LPS heptosyltransferase
LKNLYKNVSIYIVGDKSDGKWAKEIQEKIECYNMTGALNILETASLIKQADFLISTDTSVAHIADALESPSITLFGPTLISKNGPLNNSSITIRSPLECAPCQGSILMNTCEDKTKCMSAIDPAMILASVRKLLKK